MHLRKMTTIVLSSIIALSITTTSAFANITGNVTASKLNVRSGPSTTHKNIDSVLKNSSVTIIQESNGWFKVKLSNGKTGWVSAKYIRKNTNVKQSSPSRGSRVIEHKKVNANGLNIRKGPSTNEGIIGTLKKDNIVDVLESDGGWAYITFDGKTGYVSSKYLVDVSLQTSDSVQTLNLVQNKAEYSPTNDNISYVNVSISLDSYISSEVNRTKKSVEALRPYIDPTKYTINNKETFMQFLKLNKFRQVDVNKLDDYLNNLKVTSGKTNIFYNQGQAFVNTAKKYNIDPIYLVSHTLVETGFGMSALAQGHEVVLGSDGKAIIDTKLKAKHVKLKDSSTPPDVKTVKVYNLFGIGAVDSAVIPGGTTTAYDNNWTSIPSAIDGSAKWIIDKYIYKSGHSQDTLYKMRYNYVDKWHQYATDIGWATKISKHLNNLSYLYIGNNLYFEVPVYK